MASSEGRVAGGRLGEREVLATEPRITVIGDGRLEDLLGLSLHHFHPLGVSDNADFGPPVYAAFMRLDVRAVVRYLVLEHWCPTRALIGNFEDTHDDEGPGAILFLRILVVPIRQMTPHDRVTDVESRKDSSHGTPELEDFVK